MSEREQTRKKAVRKFDKSVLDPRLSFRKYAPPSDRSHCCVAVSTQIARFIPSLPEHTVLKRARNGGVGFRESTTPREIERYALAFLFLSFLLLFFFLLLLLSACSCLIRGYFYPICPLYRICWDRTGPRLVSHR